MSGYPETFDMPPAQFLDLLRSKGVSSYKNGSLHIAFAPTEPPPVTPGPAIQEDPPCKCGHPHYQHNEQGLCLMNCEPDKCAAAEK